MRRRLVSIAAAFVVPALGLLFASGSDAGVQDCDTDCQEVMTDCILDCDGDEPCIAGCKQSTVRCVKVCGERRRRLPDAGARPPVDAGARTATDARADADAKVAAKKPPVVEASADVAADRTGDAKP